MEIYDILKAPIIWKWLRIGEKNPKYNNAYIFSDKHAAYP